MILRVTQKVRDKIKLTVLDADEAVGQNGLQFLNEWYANLFTLDRRSYFIFTEATTLYSIVQESNGINNRKTFEGLATDVLFSLFKVHGDILPISLFETIAQSISIQKTVNRRVVGSQNDLIYMASAFSEDFSQINRTPMSMLEGRPDDAFNKAIQGLNS